TPAQVIVTGHRDPDAVGRTVADLAAGEARPGEPLAPDHLMLWLSSSKPVAAVAVAQLWEQGALELDDPVARHWPEFAAGGKERVTVRHLLTHTGGLRMPDPGWPGASWEEIVARVAARKLEPGWAPGEKAGYHQTASWFALGELVRRLSGRPFAEHVREEIFLPLGMDDCWIGMDETAYDAHAAAGRLAPIHDAEAGAAGAWRSFGWEARERVVRPSPGGNGWGPMRQLARLYEALVAGGRPPGGGAASRVLGPQTVEAMTARHRAGMFDHTFRHVMDWGLGFIVDSKQYGVETVPYAYGRLCSRRTYGHSGYRSSTAFADPEHRLAVALAWNGVPSAEDHERRVRDTLDALYRDLGLAADPAA
ncbi:MAG TPA: serine hydrolase domain-containing protein, partial [Thermoanaerobaculia bacterium]|nr:serine hydrolase domain-containing protein [Thermoanaerobaculia bacterium]